MDDICNIKKLCVHVHLMGGPKLKNAELFSDLWQLLTWVLLSNTAFTTGMTHYACVDDEYLHKIKQGIIWF